MSNTSPVQPLSRSSESKAASSDAEKEDAPTIVEQPLTPQYEGSGSKDDPFVVTWNTPHDSSNPREWDNLQRGLMTAQLAFGTFCVTCCSSTYSGAIPFLMRDLHMSEELTILGLSVYVAGFGLGPLLFAPLSEMYGRRPVFLLTYTPFTLFHIGCALAQNPQTLLICRFLAGAFGPPSSIMAPYYRSAPLTNSGGMISDLFSPTERALPQTLYGTAPLLGPIFGPIIGGFVAQSHTLGWRWLFGVQSIMTGANLIAALVYFPETYAPVILQRRAKKLQSQYISEMSKADSKATGGEDTHYYFVDIYHRNAKVTTSLAQKLKLGLSRPFIFLVREPIVMALAAYSAVFFSTLYAYFAGFSIVFEEGHLFNPGENGLAFIGVGVGVAIGALLTPVQTALYRRHGRKHPGPDGSPLPEARMILPMVAGISLPVGVFWFAWTSTPTYHWILPIIGGLPFGFGMALLMVAITAYLMDTYGSLCASAIAAVVVTRSISAASFPLFTPRLFRGLGTQWGISIFGFLFLLCAPLPFLLYKYGPYLRARSRYATELAIEGPKSKVTSGV